MFKKINTYFKNRRDRKFREKLSLEFSRTGMIKIEHLYNFVKTGYLE